MIDLTATIDNDEALRKLRQLQQTAKQTASNIVSDADRMDMAMARLARTLGQVGVGVSLAGLVKQIGDARGEFQKLEIAFDTMLQSEQKATVLMSQLTKTAATTPFGLQDVASGAKQLLAYGTSAEKVNETLIRLGDIAAGLSIPLGDLVYLYGTTQTQGRLFTQDLRQFQSRGIPIAEELAKQFGVTSAKVGELVTAGKVGFPEVEKAIISMTSQGGKFGGLMEAQSKTIGGLVSNLEDAFDMMFNEIGKQTEGVFTDVLKATISLVENYEKVIDILIPLVATYGSYRAALIVVAAAQKAHNAVLREAVIIKNTAIAAGRAMTKAQAVELAQTRLLTAGWKSLTASIKASTVAMLASPITWITAALAALSYGIYKVVTAESALEKAQRNVNEAMDQHRQKQEELKNKAEELHSIIKDDATTAYQQEKAYQQLIAAYPELLDKYSKEKILLMDIVALRKEIVGITDTRDRAFIEAERKKALADYNYYNEEVELRDPETGLVVGREQRSSKKAAEALEYHNRLTDQLIEMNRIQAESLPVADKIAAKQSEINKLKKEEKRIDQEIVEAQKREKINKALGRIEVNSMGSEDILQAAKQDNIRRQKALELEIKTLKDGQKTKTTLTEQELKEIKKRREKVADLTWEAQKDARQAEIDAMADGTDKILAQIDLDYDLREAAIKKREAELRALQGGRLTEEQEVAIRSARRSSGKQYERDVYDQLFKDDYEADSAAIAAGTKQYDEEREAWNEHLIEYGSYRERLQAIKDKYDQQIAEAKTEGEKADLKAQMTEDLAEVESLAGTAEAQLMDALSGLEQMLADAEAIYAEIADKNGADAKAQQSHIAELRKQYADTKSRLDERMSARRSSKGKSELPDKNAVKEWQELQRVLSEVGREFQRLGDDIGGTAGKVISATGEIATNTVSAIAGIVQFSTASLDAIKNAGNATAKAMAIAEASSVVLAALSAVMSIGQKIASMFGADYDQYNAMKARYENLTEVWDHLIDKKKEYISVSYGEEATKATEEAIRLTQQQAEAAKELGKARLNAGASVGSHSIGVRQRKRMNASDKEAVRAVAEEMGFDAESVLNGRMKGLFDLTADQLAELMKDAPTFWAKLDDDVRQYLESIIESEEQIKQLQEDNRERLTQISWDEMYSGFIDTLMDMESSAADFSEDFSEMMMRAMLNTQLSGAFQEKLRKWYEDFAAANEDGFISDSERKALQDQYNTYVDEAIDMRDKLAGVIGYGSADAQSATARGFQAMDQETGSELNGRFADIQGKMTQQLGLSEQAVKGIEFIKTISAEQYKMSIDTRDILINISGNVSQIREFTEALPQIQTAVERTSRILDERL